MTLEFSRYDTRQYPTVSVTDGYGDWSGHYEQTVHDEMDIALLDRVTTVEWRTAKAAADLACGTGRIGGWLRAHGVKEIDGVDLTPEMLDRARERNIYRSLRVADVGSTGLASESYDLVTQSLADEHLSTLTPLYNETARLLQSAGHFVLVGYHPYFLLSGQPTHYHRTTDDEPVTIRSYVHFFSDHVSAALAAGFTLVEMHERIVDDAWIAAKPKWEKYRDRPTSFAMVWRRERDR
ncbi:MAG TPA: class I SAM-dependent methyltransferase [Gemmatimonadaceae bacterium]|nr:class I SAM-dependent methyltransferase [Gemmatimonadaceae bacterium]